MTLPAPPAFARPAHDDASWYPPGVIELGGAAQWISTSTASWGFEVFGRDGRSADAYNVDAVREPLYHDPTSHPLGSWINMNWGYYIGVGPGLTLQIPQILFEFRTADEVIEAAQGSNPNPFAVTFTGQNLNLPPPPHLPPCDGLDPNGSPLVPGDWGDRLFVRVLIREDLLLGGAGDQWSGRAFMAEVVCHELGHVVTAALMKHYSESYVIDNACAIFGQPTSAWSGGAWADRVEEAVAETYKDIMLPKRAYDNRTNVQLKIDNFPDFKTLFIDWAETLYYENRDLNALSLRNGGSWDGAHGTYAGTGPSATDGFLVYDTPASPQPPPTQPAYLFATDTRFSELQSLGPFSGHIFSARTLKWPWTDGRIRIHWNFEYEPLQPEYGAKPHWADFDPQTEARINLGFQFWSADAAVSPGPGGRGVLLGRLDMEVTSGTNPSGHGMIDIGVEDLPFAPPADGLVVMFAPTARIPWAHPITVDNSDIRDQLAILPGPDMQVYDTGSGFWLGGDSLHLGFPAQADYVKPWMEAVNVPHLVQSRPLVWPYESALPKESTLAVGTLGVGVVRFDLSRVREGYS